jgi:hypothetical protein
VSQQRVIVTAPAEVVPTASAHLPEAAWGTTALGTPLPERIRMVQDMTRGGPSRATRRLLIIWFRIYVWERGRSGETSRVNLRIPIPIPFLGALLPHKMPASRAARMLADLERSSDAASDFAPYLESQMGFEFIRVEEDKHGKRELVVIGFD